MIAEIKTAATHIHKKVIENRRHLHAHPELSFEEIETAAFVKARLDEMGVEWSAMANTGVVAFVKGEQPSDMVIALRADMDALPITETGDVAYASKRKGVMHACGHDAHTASLLGTIAILQSVKNKFGGTVKCIFQPAEEKLPGGASLMIREGVLENPKPACIIGQHVMPGIKTGKIAMRPGKMMASMDELFVTVYGRGGHGAMPHQNIDPVLIASHIIVALQQVISRLNNPLLPGVLSFGKLIADGGINVIPDKVYMEGTFRTIDETWRTEAHQRIKKMAESIAESMGGRCEFTIVKGYPVLVNEQQLTGDVRRFAEEYLGNENVIDTDILMAAEDFAYYSETTRACFYFTGTGNKEKKTTAALHTAAFDIDEDALSASTGLMAYIALKLLSASGD